MTSGFRLSRRGAAASGPKPAVAAHFKYSAKLIT